MNKLKISHHLCYMCHSNLSISSKKLYCRVYSLESGYLCDLCEKPFSTGYASKKPLPARSFCANRTKSVKMKQLKTTDDRIPAVKRIPTLNCAENGRRKPLKTTDRIPDEIRVRRMPTLKCVENVKRKQTKTTNKIPGESCVRRMPTLKPAENVKRKLMKTDRLPDEVSVRRMSTLKRAKNVGRKAVIADELNEGVVKKLPNSKLVKSSKKEPDGQKILTKSSIIVGDVRKSNMDCHDIHNLDKMSKCVVRIQIDPSLVEKIKEYQNRLKVQNQKRFRNRKN